MRRPCERKDIGFKYALREQMEVRNISPSQLAPRIGVSEKTFYNRLNKPETFRVSELRMLVSTLNMPMEALTKWI